MSSEEQGPQLTQEEEDHLLDTIVGLIDVPMFLLALVSLALIVVEFTVQLTSDQSRTIAFVQTLIWVVFIAEFSLRVFLAENRARYLKRHWFDALIVLIPFLRVFYILRAIRALRLLRLINPTALARTFFTTRRTTRNLGDILGRSSLPYVVLTTLIVSFVSAAALFLLERNAGGSNITTYGNALWYVAGVISTVGKEKFPITPEGRVLAVLLMIYGVGIFGYLAGTLASYFVQTNVQRPTPIVSAKPSPHSPGDHTESTNDGRT